jgi:hypothetical protein
MRKPNYNMERKDRERAKQAKAAAKVEKRLAKGADNRQTDNRETQDHADPQEAQTAKSND